ncbi:MAG: NAD-dependent epimerase/dehydratase family protein [Candidatus Xenobia bacterium]
MGRRAFLTGGSGFVGLNLAQELIAQGWEVTAVHRPTSELRWLRELKVDLIEGSVADVPDGIDTVFHVAGNTNMWRGGNAQQTRDNVDVTREVAAAAVARKVRRLVVTSSIAAWGIVTGEVDESTPQRGKDSWINYHRTKHLAELEAKAAMAHGLEVVVMNPCHVMGPYDFGTWSRLFQMIKQDRLPGVPPGAGSYAHVKEVARAHVAAADRGENGGNYILGGANHARREMIAAMCRLLGKPVPTRVTPPPAIKAAAWVSQFMAERRGQVPELTPEAATLVSLKISCSAQRAQRDLGYRVVPLETMVEDSYKWLVDEGRL